MRSKKKVKKKTRKPAYRRGEKLAIYLKRGTLVLLAVVVIAALVLGARDRMDRVRTAVRGAPAPSVLAIEWLAPPFLPGHWVPEMVEIAGGVVLEAQAALPSRQVSWEALDGLDPDVLVVMPCGYDLTAAQADAEAHGDRLRAVAPRALADGRAWVVDGSAYFNRSGPRVVDGVEMLGAILHPARLTDVDLTGRAAQWFPGD